MAKAKETAQRLKGDLDELSSDDSEDDDIVSENADKKSQETEDLANQNKLKIQIEPVGEGEGEDEDEGQEEKTDEKTTESNEDEQMFPS